ncbi:hypothetical protein PF003_g22441 [Phytophthora fragariae]|nr:hypothetical protein PF003_g22441 [Phytophthora fragariae]
MGKGRQKHTENGGRRPRAYKWSVPTHPFRLDIVRYFETYTMEATMSEFYKGLTGSQRQTKRTSVYLWRKNKDKLEELCKTTATSQLRKVRLRGMATTLTRDTEVHIVQWINTYRVQGLSVSSLMLHRKALSIAKDMGIPRNVFAASRGWATGFLRRHHLAFRAKTRQGQTKPDNADAALHAFNVQVKQKMAELGVDVVYNADQTPVFFEYLPKSTITTKGAKTVWVRSTGKDKERFTCMLLGDSLGRKYPPYLVLKVTPSKIAATRTENYAKRHGFDGCCGRSLATLQARNNVIIYGNNSGWWNERLTIDWLRFNFGSRPDMDTPMLLLLDEFSGHWTDSVLACARELNVELMPVPAGCTSVCQPADVAWNRPLKTRLRTRWIEYLEQQMADHEASVADGKTFKMIAPSRDDVVEWVASAWGDLTADTIANGFRGVLKETSNRSAKLS